MLTYLHVDSIETPETGRTAIPGRMTAPESERRKRFGPAPTTNDNLPAGFPAMDYTAPGLSELVARIHKIGRAA